MDEIRSKMLKHLSRNTVEQAEEISKTRKRVEEAFRQGRLEKKNEDTEHTKNARKKYFQQNMKTTQEQPILKKKGFKNLTVKEAKDLSKTRNKVEEALRQGRQENVDKMVKETEKVENLKPVTDALKDVIIAIKEQEKKPPEIYSTQPEILALPSTSGTRQNYTTFGPVISGYISELKDSTFGVYKDNTTKNYMIGSEIIGLLGEDDFSVKGKKYTATPGLMLLLTQTKIIRNEYTPEDLLNYKQILVDSNAMHRYNKPGEPVKSSKSDKYITIIKPIWESCRPKKGSGLVEYIEDPREYINDIMKTEERLQYIASEERAGNTNFHKEKILILDEIYERLRHLVDVPQGDTENHALSTEFCLSLLRWFSERTGSGFFNNLLNSKYMPELHAPGYNFLGPGTHLSEKIKNNVQPINKLDAAAKKHDIFYSKNKDTKSRHVADKNLQKEAWEIAVNPNTPFDEKIYACFTTAAMKTKRYLGMGLK